MWSSLFDSPINWSLRAGLDFTALKQRTISDNIANADTPYYKAVRLNFRDYYEQAKRAIATNTKELLPDPKQYIFRDESTTMRLDGNNVDPEKEMVELARNSLVYSTLIELVNRRGGILMLAITEGRG
jgi:flagellar basal-body rod protein FlgB